MADSLREFPKIAGIVKVKFEGVKLTVFLLLIWRQIHQKFLLNKYLFYELEVEAKKMRVYALTF